MRRLLLAALLASLLASLASGAQAQYTNPGHYSAPFTSLPPLPNAKFISGTLLAQSAGDIDIYTVPANKRALIISVAAYNASGNTAAPYPTIKHGGTYYRLATTGSINNNAGGNVLVNAPIVFEAGDILSVHSDQNLAVVGAVAVEFDNTSALKTAFIFGTASGDNTLYTVPVGKSALVYNLNSVGLGIISNGVVAFSSGATGATIVPKLTPSGGAATQIRQSVALSTNSAGTVSFAYALNSADAIVVNIASSNDTAQLVWVTVAEL